MIEKFEEERLESMVYVKGVAQMLATVETLELVATVAAKISVAAERQEVGDKNSRSAN